MKTLAVNSLNKLDDFLLHVYILIHISVYWLQMRDGRAGLDFENDSGKVHSGRHRERITAEDEILSTLSCLVCLL